MRDIIRLNVFLLPQPAEVRKKVFITFKIWIFFFKNNTWIRYREPLFIPRSRVRDVLLRMRVLYFTSSELYTANTRLSPLRGLEGPGQFLI